jgi:hypothetical protein
MHLSRPVYWDSENIYSQAVCREGAPLATKISFEKYSELSGNIIFVPSWRLTDIQLEQTRLCNLKTNDPC